jgi:chemotaxis protein MotA
MRTATTGVLDPYDIDQMMDLDMEKHHEAATQPVSALSTTADSLPGLGIVAAVLGSSSPWVRWEGHRRRSVTRWQRLWSALFLGILLCYGLLGPIASNMSKIADEEQSYYHVLRVCMMAFVKGVAPIMAVEVARSSVPGHVRPKFQELESLCRNKGAAAEPVSNAA